MKAGMKMSKSFNELYMESSKHSNYQILPSNLKGLVDDSMLNIQSRYEKERLEYMLNNVNPEGKSVLDIGGNIGFFTFETVNKGAAKVDYYEGNTTHAEFVKKAVDELKLNDKIDVYPEYFLFEGSMKKYDIAYLLNVVHHFGDDFGNEESLENAKKAMLKCINYMAGISKVMLFQMGFNWCGDRNRCLWANGTKKEMEEFIENGTSKYWNIVKIGVAVKKGDVIIYEDMNDINNERNDSLGEFLNRPIFIMKSKLM